MTSDAPLHPTEDAGAGTGRWLDRGDHALGLLIEIPAALATVAEVVLLLLGVISRFVFNNPLVWSDELAGIVFLWLAMFGAAAALRRGQHMRLTTLAGRMHPATRAAVEALAVLVPLVFLLVMSQPAFDFAQDQGFVETPALGWSDLTRAAAVPVGFGLMALIAAMRLVRQGWAPLLAAAAVLLAVAALLYAGQGWITALGNWNLALFFVLLVGAGVLLGVPIAFCFALATVAYLLCTTTTPLAVVASRIQEGMSGLILLAVPLFILLGLLIEVTGMARAMVAFLANLLGHVRGGLNYVLLGAMLLVSGISGAKTADMAAVAPVLFPEMRRRGLNDGEMVSLLAASGAMAETIPPSLVLIAIGSVSGVSIAALFTGGLLPGIVLAIVLAIVARQRSSAEDLRGVRRAPVRVVLWSLVVAVPALVLPFLIRAAVVEGVATATEVSTIGIVYVLVVGPVIYGRIPLRRALPILIETASLSGAILFIIGAATAMAWALTQSGFSHALVASMSAVPGGRWGFLLISILAFIVLGSVLEGIPAMVLFGPLLFPAARAVGVHEVHYAIVIILAMGIGLFAPPFGLGYYAACTIGRVSPDAALRRIWPYLAAVLAGLLIVAAIPWISVGFL